jgi:hypothetical protein
VVQFTGLMQLEISMHQVFVVQFTGLMQLEISMFA